MYIWHSFRKEREFIVEGIFGNKTIDGDNLGIEFHIYWGTNVKGDNLQFFPQFIKQ